MPKTPEVASMCTFPTRVVPAGLFDKLLLLQEKMNVVPQQLLTTRTTGDLHHKELDLNTELASHLNGAEAAKAIKQAIEAIKQSKVHHAPLTCVVQQLHRDSVLVLEHQMKAEERSDHQALMEAFGAAI